MKPASEADVKPWLEKLLPHNPTMVGGTAASAAVEHMLPFCRAKSALLWLLLAVVATVESLFLLAAQSALLAASLGVLCRTPRQVCWRLSCPQTTQRAGWTTN